MSRAQLSHPHLVTDRFHVDTEGRFLCPVEGIDCAYAAGWDLPPRRRLAPRRRHLADAAAPVVLCLSCGGRYEIGVLSLPTVATMAETLDALMLGAVGELLRHLAAGPALICRAHAVLAHHLRGATEVALAAEVACIRPEEVDQLAARASVFLTDAGKRVVLTTCAQVAALPGAPSPAADAMLDRLGEALGMEPAGVRSVRAACLGHDGLSGWVGP